MFEQLKKIMVTKFQLDAGTMTPTTTLEELELDSLDRVELSLVIDAEMGAKVTDDEIGELPDLQAILDLIERRSATV